jgi:hypothetical protein
VPFNVWTHLVFTQKVGEGGIVERQALYLNGQEFVSSKEKTPFHNPSPTQVGAVFNSVIRALVPFTDTYGYSARLMG